jgi:hypothetical protein
MMGRQSHNVGLPVLPAPGEVTIDGGLADWDFSGRIWVFADYSFRDQYGVEAAAMWDARHLYLAAKWRDPTAMVSHIDPQFNPNDGWKSDSWQIRIRTDKITHVTTWYYTPKRMPAAHVEFGKSATEAFGGPGAFVVSSAGGTKLGRGIEMAYRKSEDGRGFVQELQIPWSILFAKRPDIAAGLTLRLGLEFLWGDPTGKTWPSHRYADNLQPGVTAREFYWKNWKLWGDATLAAKGDVPLREYTAAGERPSGTVPVRATIPRDAARFTLVVEDAEGQRVRNLAADFDPADYTVDVEGERRAVEVQWDCLDDWGRLVRAGTYSVRGLTHTGLRAKYDMCFYNPGTPPWRIRDGSGAWGGDHGAPLRVAAAGEWTIVSWPFAEGGSGIIGIGRDDRKKWGEKRGATVLAADARHVYALISSWHVKTPVLCRFAAEDGSYRPFVRDGETLPFELKLSEVLAGVVPGELRAMAARDGLLAMATSEGRLALVGTDPLELTRVFDAPDPSAVAFGPAGELYAVLGGVVHRIQYDGTRRALRLQGLGKSGPIAVTAEGHLAVADLGLDDQIKVFRPARGLFGPSKTRYEVAWTAGGRGGRARRGPFDPQTLAAVSSIAVDHRGRIWAVESTNTPRRVSVWDRGGLVRDYVGNTGYAGTGCFLHDQDPTLAYVGPVEVRLDRQKRSWRVSEVTWVPDRARGESFPIDPGSHRHAQRLTSAASGQPREYLFGHDGPQVVYMKLDGLWRPVSAVCMVAHISGRVNRHNVVEEVPSGEFAGLEAHDGVFWIDKNHDGRVQRYECTIIPTNKPGKLGDGRTRGEPGLPIGNGWGGRIGSDLSFWADGLVRYAPVGFTADGAPIYGVPGMTRYATQERGDLVPVPEEGLLLCLSFKGYAKRTTGMLGVDAATGEVRWSYPNPFPGVHGSHRAPMARPGLLIGPLKICGVARVDERVGRVFVLRGNLGQDAFMTTDGLYVGALFRDGRLPSEALPESSDLLLDMPMHGFSHGSEPFNGWFGRHADGKIRMTTGFARQACMILQVGGLDSIRRFEAGPVRVDNATLVAADAANVARATAPAEAKTLTVARMRTPPTIDGDPREWGKMRPVRIERPGLPDKAAARIAYDARNLYLLFEVQDASPWVNEGLDLQRLFKTGDAVDLQLCTDPRAKPNRAELLPSDVRVVLSQISSEPAAVLMRPVVVGTKPEDRVRYHSPVGDRYFDRVEHVRKVPVAVKTGVRSYCLEAAIPLALIGLRPKPGMTLRGDLGFISSDARGMINVARTYWANTQTNLVSDLPHEAWLYPARWGEFQFE